MKAKKNFLSITKILMCFVMVFSLLNQNMVNTKAAATIYSYNPNAEIPAEYYNQYTGYKTNEMTMSSHFIPTPSEGVGNITASNMKYYVPESTLKNANNFGKIWWQYNNIMTVNNQKVHIRFTALSWNNTSLRYGYLGIRTSSTIGAYTPRNTRLKVEFINASTGNPISVQTSLTGRDFDSATEDSNIEKMTIHSGIDRVYLGEWMTNSGQTIWNAHGTDVTSSEARAWATFCINGSSFEYTFTKGGQLVFYKGEGVVPVEKRYKITTKSTNATITATQNEIIKGQSRTISWTAKDGYFISSVKVDGVSQPINSYRSGSYTFSNIQADHTVEVVATAQYYITTQGTNAKITDSIYNLDPNTTKAITWTANDGYWISSVVVDGVPQSVNSYRNGSYTFNNINANHDVKVVANPCYTITTEIVNGNITSNQTKIDPHENRTISFSPNDGYYVSEVIVDGTAYSYKDYPSSYTFSNINANHSIKVVCEPLKTITTEIENGVITKTMTGLHPDDIKDIYYNAFYEYYIESVVVDGKNITVNDFVEGNYEFDPVITDHYIKVVCQPKPRITTEITNGEITPEFTVFPHEEGKTVAEAHPSYYISRVIVDGKEIKDFDEYKNIYTFKDVTENHHIYVECNPMPQLSVDKTTNKETYNYKDTVQYTITLKQTRENAIAYNTFLRDSDLTEGVKIDMDSLKVNGLDENKYTLQKNVDDFELKINELSHNQTVTVTFNATVDDKNLVNKRIENHVYATSDHFNEQVHDSVVNQILKPQLSIVKSTDKEKYNAYDKIQYNITVSQTVDRAKAFNVNVSDVFPQGVDVDLDSFVIDGIDKDMYSLSKDNEGFELMIDELTYQENVTVSFVGSIADPTLAGKNISNTATVTSETNDSTVKSTVTNEIHKPQLVLSKTSDKEYYNVEDEATFNIVLVQSVEDAIAYNVVLTDTDISNGVDIDWKSLQITGLDKDNYTIQKYSDKGGFELKIKQLHSDDVVNIRYTARINDNSLAGSEVSNTVNAMCDNNTDIIKATVTKPVLKPELSIQKTTDGTDYNVGDELEFVLKINQTKENAIANHVVVKDFDLSEGILLDLDTIIVEGLDETLYTINKDAENKTFQVEINALAYHQEVIIKVKGKIIDNALAGDTISNSASVCASNNSSIVSDTATADVYKPELQITKTSDKEVYNYKDVVTYKIDLKQTVDGARANDVLVKDVLPDGLELNLDSFVYEGVNAKDIQLEKTEDGFSLKITSLKDKLSVTYQAKITEPTLAGKTIKNTASVTSSNNTEVITTEVINTILKPELSVEKTSDKEFYNYQDTITYTVDVRQKEEGATACNIVLEDILPEGLVLDINSFTFNGIDNKDVEIEETEKGFILKTPTMDNQFSFSYQAKINVPTLAGTDIINKVQVSCINNPEVIENSKTDTIIRPVLDIQKSSDKESYNYKDVVTYTLDIFQKDEGATAFDIVIKDVLPKGLKLDVNSFVFEGIDKKDVKILETKDGFLLEMPLLKDKISVSYQAMITEPKLSGTEIKNVASVTSSNNTDVIETELVNKVLMPVFEIEKNADREFYNINDTIHYTVNAKQVVDDAKAYDVVLDDSHLNKGLKFKQETIKVNGLEEENYRVEIKEQGYYLLHLDYMSDEEIQVEYDVDVIDPTLAGQKIEHEVYITCINNPKVEEWKSSVENVVLKPQFNITKTPSIERAKIGDKLHYDVEFKQVVENANAFHVVLNDWLDDNQKLDINSIVVKADDMSEDDYTIEETIIGFAIHFKEIKGIQTIRVGYDVEIVNDSKDTATNIAWLESSAIDKEVAQTEIEIYRDPVVVKTGDNSYLEIFSIISLVGLVGIIRFKNKKKTL